MILAEKLESLRKCVLRLEDKRATSVAELSADLDRQEILTLNLTRAVQLCVDMATHILATTEEPAPTSMGEAFDGLAHLGLIDSTLQSELKAAVGFRNVAIHNYQQLSLEIVHAITWHHLEDFRAFAGIVSHRLDGSLKQSRP